MCGRFAFYSPSEATAALFGVTQAAPVEPRYNIAPTTWVAGIRNGENDERELAMFKWGLIPFWAKDASIGNRMINARAETVAEKPAYRAAYKRRRCFVLADGFYEWHTEGGIKIPYFFSAADGNPFAFAALWENWTNKDGGESIDSTTLITTAANDFMARLHHRMPVVLTPDLADYWMAGNSDAIEHAVENAPELQVWAVDRRVNNARNDDATLIQAAS